MVHCIDISEMLRGLNPFLKQALIFALFASINPYSLRCFMGKCSILVVSPLEQGGAKH